jgi:hypothetical protein
MAPAMISSIASPLTQSYLRRVVAHEHGGERGAETAATRVKFLRSGHSMIWSARASSDGGIVRPSAFAVLRLITRSNFVGRSIGMSPG